MTQVRKFRVLLTGTHRYEKTLSTRDRGQGEMIDAPILAYLIETANGRLLYDVGCDYRKLDDSARRARFYGAQDFPFGPPRMHAEQRVPHLLQTLGLEPQDVDLVFLGHLHFDHAGGLHEWSHAEIHTHASELKAAREPADGAYFADDFDGDYRWKLARGEYDVVDGVRALETPGHTAGHMSLYVELPRGKPIIIAGDAADLQENLHDEIAPGLCWRDREDLAVDSIRRLKALAQETGADIWPNHDMAFYQGCRHLPDYYA